MAKKTTKPEPVKKKPAKSPKRGAVVLLRNIALGEGNREGGFIIGQIAAGSKCKPGDVLGPDEITAAPGVTAREISTLLNNPTAYQIK